MSSCPSLTAPAQRPRVRPSAPTPVPSDGKLGRGMTLCFALSVGIMVLNLFAAQPLAGPIAKALQLPPRWAGLVPMLPQLGYAAGLVLLVPLADLLENRRLIVATLAVCAATLALTMAAPGRVWALAAIFIAGAASCAIQMMVPMAAWMSDESARGRTVGNVMSGLMVGILLSRPLASWLGGMWGWRAFYGVLAALDALLVLALLYWLPRREPTPTQASRTGRWRAYGALLLSLGALLRREPVLRWRALTAALCMAGFSLFWTAVALLLAQPPFGLGAHGLALFALAGVAGALVSPLAGAAGDRGHTGAATWLAHATVIAAFGLAALSVDGGRGAPPALALAGLVLSAILLDAGVTLDQTLGRRAINLLDAAARGRLNGLFVGIFFIGGGSGATLAGVAWAWGGWHAVCGLGAVLGIAAMAVHAASARDSGARGR